MAFLFSTKKKQEKLPQNSFKTFLLILLTDRQKSNKSRQKHNLLDGGMISTINLKRLKDDWLVSDES